LTYRFFGRLRQVKKAHVRILVFDGSADPVSALASGDHSKAAVVNRKSPGAFAGNNHFDASATLPQINDGPFAVSHGVTSRHQSLSASASLGARSPMSSMSRAKKL
jgi:hypothetical protein